jgi:cell division transport system permease protein
VRLRVIVGEAFRSLGASMSTTVAATLTVLIGMFVLGLTIALGTWVLAWSDHAKKQLLAEVFFCTPAGEGCSRDATAKEIERVRLWLAKDERVESIEFISTREALEIAKRRWPDLTENLTYNPLPPSFRVIPTRAEYTDDIKRDLLRSGPGGTKPAGVERVKDGGETARRVVKVGGIIEAVFLVGLVVLLVASTLLIANTIRLSIFARRREIEVMKLVGATNWFVRGPFMIEGLICGLAGSAAAVLLLVIGKELVLPSLPHWERDSSDIQALAFELNALAILGAGLLLGAVGSALTLHRFLRV